jgi:hypothetical protein
VVKKNKPEDGTYYYCSDMVNSGKGALCGRKRMESFGIPEKKSGKIKNPKKIRKIPKCDRTELILRVLGMKKCGGNDFISGDGGRGTYILQLTNMKENSCGHAEFY